MSEQDSPHPLILDLGWRHGVARDATIAAGRARTAKRLLAIRELAHLWEAQSEAVTDVLRETENERNELRALIEPLLAEPFEELNPFWVRCRFCLSDSRVEQPEHATTCPVLRRETLLGRESGDD